MTDTDDAPHAAPETLPGMPPVEGQVSCARCGRSKPVDEFSRDVNRSTGRDPWCLTCRREWGVEYRAANPLVAHRRNLRRYNITAEDYERLMASQANSCAICGRPDPVASGTGPRRLHVDHDHATGMVRGLLCSDCNVGLGMFKDDPSRMVEAMMYLADPPARAALRDENTRLVTPCARCGGMFDPYEWEDRHTAHTDDCWEGDVVCTCDVNYHTDCCRSPECT